MESTFDTNHLFAVILAGGSGTRLWPMSRDNTPKQFLRLGGEKTMLQRTFDRIAPLVSPDHIIIVTSARSAEDVQKQLPLVPAQNIIAEPTQRDTALAMALGALVASTIDPDAVVVNLASDHVLKDEEGYRRTMVAAATLAAEQKHLITVGIKPSGPNVNFGYIHAAGELMNINGFPVYQVTSFKEKPDLQTAQQFLDEGNYYWNANMYTWHVAALRQAIEKYCPAMGVGLERIRPTIGTPEFISTLAEVYESAEKISIDYAVSEKADNLVLFSGDFGWDDIGLWSTVYDLGEKDENGTVIVRDQTDQSPVMAMDSQRNLINTNGRLVALIGVSDLVVIDSKDVIMILPRDRAGEVKNVVNELKARSWQQYL